MIRKFVLAAVAVACCISQLPGHAASAAAPKPVETWAWCGMHPDDPNARVGTQAMARVAGIDATFGPCKNAPVGYSPAFPGDRYITPELYMRLVVLNAEFGMQTAVYDARIWDDDPVIREAAKVFWRPVYEHIVAWDMGDEFDPASPDWALLIERTQIVLDDVTLDSDIEPFSNHLPFAVEEALRDIPGQSKLLSFDKYDGDQGESIARQLDGQVDVLMCAVNSYVHSPYLPTSATIRDATKRLVDAGCDMILTFGGSQVYGSVFLGQPSATFGAKSIIDRSGNSTDFATAVLEANGASSYVPVRPARLLESRTDPGLSTVDGQSNSIGRRAPATTTEVQVGGRASVRSDAAAAVLTVTAINSSADGFISVYPCGSTRPNVAQVNHGFGDNVATTVVVKLPTSGKVCLFNLTETDLVVDVAGYHPAGNTFTALQPARLLDTRPATDGFTTVDGSFLGVGVRGAGSVTQLTVSGRAGVPFGASAATMSVTVANAATAGFVTVYPCGQPQPPTASVNFSANEVVTNAVVSGIASTGWVCIYTSADIDLVVDANGFNPSDASFVPIAPQRLIDTRATTRPPVPTSTVLDTAQKLAVTGVAGVPDDANSVVVNLTVTEATRSGFVTVYPCGTERPNASNINFVAGQTVSNMVVAEVGLDGEVCLFSSADPEYVIDLTAYHP